jgi:SAM-dependent methyltransferase
MPGASEVASAFDALANAHNTFVCSQPPSLADLITWDAIQRCLPGVGTMPVLDVGGGNGVWAIRIAQCGYPVVMVDISVEMLLYAAENIAAADLGNRIKLQQADAHTLECLPPNMFPLVLAVGDLLNYTHKPELILDQLRRVCRSGGMILATVIGRNGLIDPLLRSGDEAALTRLLLDGDWEERSVEEVAQHSTSDRASTASPLRLHAFTPYELKGLFIKAGLRPQRVFSRGMVSSLLRPQEADDLAARIGAEAILKWEMRLDAEPSLLGCASGLGIVSMKE